MNDAVLSRVNLHRSGEKGRGRRAKMPHHIPWLGWKDIALRLKDEIAEDRVGTIAAGTTFFLLLSLFPALAAVVSLYGLIADPRTMAGHLSLLTGYVPAAAIELVGSELNRLTSSREATLGVGFVAGILLSLWSANSGMRALFDALNLAYDETEKRGFFKRLLLSCAFTVGGSVFLIVLLNLSIGIPLLVRFLDLGVLGEIVVAVLPGLLMLGVGMLGMAMLYRYGPSRATPRWEWITPGSALAAVAWVAGSVLFSWYVARWANYSATYGSLGAIVGVLLWIYLSLWIVLAGAELNAEIEHQTAVDTTVGPEQPLGQRGASMADSVGEARA